MAVEATPLEQRFTLQDIQRRQRYVGLDNADLAYIVRIRDLVHDHVDGLVDAFFKQLGSFEEAANLLRQPALLAEARRLKRQHLLGMVSGQYDVDYAQQRAELAVLYSRAGIDVRVVLSVYQHLLRSIGQLIQDLHGGDTDAAFLEFMALNKIGFFDIGITVDVLVDERERTIRLQQQAIRELSTPVLQLRERLLVLPIIGVIDTQRAKQLTDSLLLAIRDNRAKVVVMDITGVAAVDSKVANHLTQTVAAARLMGARTIITGLSADVAQALVALGGDALLINTVGDLQGGIEEAERLLGLQVVATAPIAPTLA